MKRSPELATVLRLLAKWEALCQANPTAEAREMRDRLRGRLGELEREGNGRG